MTRPWLKVKVNNLYKRDRDVTITSSFKGFCPQNLLNNKQLCTSNNPSTLTLPHKQTLSFIVSPLKQHEISYLFTTGEKTQLVFSPLTYPGHYLSLAKSMPNIWWIPSTIEVDPRNLPSQRPVSQLNRFQQNENSFSTLIISMISLQRNTPYINILLQAEVTCIIYSLVWPFGNLQKPCASHGQLTTESTMIYTISYSVTLFFRFQPTVGSPTFKLTQYLYW